MSLSSSSSSLSSVSFITAPQSPSAHEQFSYNKGDSPSRQASLDTNLAIALHQSLRIQDADAEDQPKMQPMHVNTAHVPPANSSKNKVQQAKKISTRNKATVKPNADELEAQQDSSSSVNDHQAGQKNSDNVNNARVSPARFKKQQEKIRRLRGRLKRLHEREDSRQTLVAQALEVLRESEEQRQQYLDRIAALHEKYRDQELEI